jgi:hypothetical protein
MARARDGYSTVLIALHMLLFPAAAERQHVQAAPDQRRAPACHHCWCTHGVAVSLIEPNEYDVRVLHVATAQRQWATLGGVHEQHIYGWRFRTG